MKCFTVCKILSHVSNKEINRDGSLVQCLKTIVIILCQISNMMFGISLIIANSSNQLIEWIAAFRSY